MRLQLLILVTFFCVRPVLGQDSSRYELLWEIKDKKTQHVSYLFGSMHSNDQRLFQFPDSLYYAFVKADQVIVETDMSQLFDTYDVRLDPFSWDVFERTSGGRGNDKTSKTVYGDENGRPQFLDAYFQQTAYCSGKKVRFLETFDEQIAVTEKVNSNPSFGLSTIFYSEESFKKTYIQGDIAALSKMLKVQLRSNPGSYEQLITRRNQIMANGLDSLFRKSNSFCAIGSGHLYGNEGVLQLLRKAGFNVRAVKASYTGSLPEKAQMQNWRSFQHFNNTWKFSIELGGKPVESNDFGFYQLIYQELGQGNTYEVHASKTITDLDAARVEFIHNSFTKPKELKLPDGTLALEGMVKNSLFGYQWKRIFVKDGITYELICFGGNKFMHSNRPQLFFNRFKFL